MKLSVKNVHKVYNGTYFFKLIFLQIHYFFYNYNFYEYVLSYGKNVIDLIVPVLIKKNLYFCLFYRKISIRHDEKSSSS